MSETRTGSCHCGAVTFSILGESNNERYVRCNCSLCTRKNRGVVLVASDRFQLNSPLENLSSYRWNTGRETHYFCNTCGIHTHHTLADAPERIGVHAACVDGIDLDLVDWEHGDGASIPVVN
ncbi:MAG: GFA family protein [Pseudomonadota bacterium]